MMHKDINHSQHISSHCDDTVNCSNDTIIKQEIKEEADEDVDEGQDVEDTNLDADHLVDCSQYVQVQMKLSK